jgi:hypothetical protein
VCVVLCSLRGLNLFSVAYGTTEVVPFPPSCRPRVIIFKTLSLAVAGRLSEGRSCRKNWTN